MNEEYKQIFSQESDELLQQMNSSLLLLEKDTANADALHAIFRSAHTLKSMSASMGYMPIADLSHKMEDVLGEIRSGVLAVTDNVIDLLFKTFDLLDRMVTQVQKDESAMQDIAPLVSILDKLLTKKRMIPEEKVMGDLSLNSFEKKSLANAKKDGFLCYFLKITLEDACVLKAVRAFMVFRNLHSLGEVIKSVPESSKIEEEKFDRQFGCVLVTKENEEVVRSKVMEILEIEDVSIETIPVDLAWDIEISYDQLPDKGLAATTNEHLKKIQNVRVDIESLDKMMNLVEELAITKLRLFDVSLRMQDLNLKTITEMLGRITDSLQMEVMEARLVPVAQIFDRFPRMVRDLAKKQGKKIKFEVVGGDIELDRTVLDEIGDSMIHLLKNAIDHGIETPEERKINGKDEEATIILSARREKSHVFIDVEDDGKGMNVEDIKQIAVQRGLVGEDAVNAMSEEDILFLTANPGFSTKKEVTEVSGRGVGLDVVKNTAESLGGSVLIESKLNYGTKISLRLPVTTAVVQALLVKAVGSVYAFPISNVVEIVVIEKQQIKKVEGQETFFHRGDVMPMVRLDKMFRFDNVAKDGEKINILIVEFGSKQFGIVVDELLRQQDIVIKQLTKELKGVKGFAGATILGDGSVAFVLDVATLI